MPTLITNRSGSPSTMRVVQPARVGMFTERSFGAIAPGQLSAVLKSADTGQLEQFADLAEWVAEDDRIASVLDTRIDNVIGLAYDVQPGAALPGQEAIAKQAADMCRDMLANTSRIENVFEEMLNAIWLGYSLSEHQWERKRGLWVSTPAAIRARDIRFVDVWDLEARNYGASGTGQEWLNTNDYPDKFVPMVYRKRGSTPLRSGAFRSVVWYWLFKRWALKFWVAGAERLATPPMIGKVARDAHAESRTALKEGLENLSDGQAAILEENTGIEFPDTKFAQSSDVWKALVEKCDDGITLAILGSLDTVDAGGDGSRARAETQASYTIDARTTKVANFLYSTIEQYWFKPFLWFNGIDAPTPKMSIKSDELVTVSPIYQYHLQGKIVSRNDVRAQLNLPPLPEGMGGDELLDIGQAPAGAPAFSGAHGGESAALPLARQLSQSRSNTTRAKATETLPTSSGLATTIVKGLLGR